MKKKIAAILVAIILVSSLGCAFVSSANDTVASYSVSEQSADLYGYSTGTDTDWSTGTDTDCATGTDAEGDIDIGEIISNVFSAILSFFSWLFSILGI